MSKSHPEDILQRQCVHWFAMQYPKLEFLMHHSPNGGYRTRVEAGIFKAMGVRPGFPDLILLEPSNGYSFLAIELKSEKGYQSPTQKAMQGLLEEHGGRYLVIRSKDAFIDAVQTYLTPVKITPQILEDNGWELKEGIWVLKANTRLGWYPTTKQLIVGYGLMPEPVETLDQMQCALRMCRLPELQVKTDQKKRRKK